LNKIRALANQQYCQEQQRSEKLRNDSSHFHYSPTSSSAQEKSSSVSPCCYCSSRSTGVCFNCHLCHREQSHISLDASANLNGESMNHEGELIVMRSLRELLWYWTEYYLRRGRDRLSIEFSSRISFRFWYDLVGKSIISACSYLICFPLFL
jgi:hypothetical protein